MSSVVDWLNDNFKNLDHEVFRNVISISDAKMNPLDDGQAVIISDINRITLTLELLNGGKRTIKAVAKFEPPPGPGRDMATDCGAFDTEIMMYTDVLKSMERLMLQVGDSVIPWTQCYHASDNKLLLCDIGETGYKVVPAYEFLDLDHSLLVMKALGKFHALSMIMNDRGLLDKTKLKLKPSPLARAHPLILQFYNASTNALAEACRDWGPEWYSLSERLDKFMATPKETLENIFRSVSGTWDVLNHGDFSMRNVLFHYEPGSKTPDDVKFVDFQMCHYSSLGLDIATLLYSSLLPQMREENMNKLLGSYADSLASTCQQHGYKGPIPSSDNVDTTLRQLSFITTATSFCTIPFYIATEFENMQAAVDEAFDETYNETLTNSSSKNGKYHQIYSNKKIQEIMKYEVRRCVKENYI